MMQHTRSYALAIALAVSSTARADDIPTVKVGSNGPEQNVPTDKAFYLSGDAGKEATNAVAVVVRKGSNSMFGGDGPRCSELADLVHLKQLADKPPDPGVHKVSEQFRAAAAGYRDNPLLVSSTWKASDGDSTYKVLVPNDKQFFSAGYAFCLYVLVTKKHQEIDDRSIAKLIADAVGKLLACGDAPGACRNRVLAELRQNLDKRLKDAELVAKPEDRAKAIEQIIAKVNKSLTSANAVLADRSDLLTLLATPPVLPEPTRHWLDTNGGLGKVVVTLLGNQGTLFPQRVTTKQGSKVVRVVKDGTIEVGAVSVLDDDLKLRVAASATAAATQVRVLEEVTTRNLAVTSDVSLYDLLSIDHGQVRSDPEIHFDALKARVDAISLAKPWTADDKTVFGAAAERLGRIADVMQASWDATTAPADDASRAAIGFHFGEWLHAVGYNPQNLVRISADLKQLVLQKTEWDTVAPSLSFETKTVISVDGPQPIPLSIGFTEETWVFSYVTPTIGYAQIYGGDDGWFSHLYLGAQIHFWPNPADEPLWRHGITEQDLKRSFALELGFAPSVSQFGPDNRYRGVFGLPPPTVAAAFHLVPYTSLSFGWALLDRRQTVLTAEDPRFAARFFIGLNVQFNIPDLIRAASTKNAPTTVEKK
jgi:hypothetical protein